MPTEIEAAGYENLRNYVQNNWDHIALANASGAELVRIDIPNDPRASFISGSGSNPLEAELIVTGQDIIDAGNQLPIQATRTEAYTSQSATTRMGYDPIADVTFEAPNDELTILHEYSLPK
jgi:hypothetical protein